MRHARIGARLRGRRCTLRSRDVRAGRRGLRSQRGLCLGARAEERRHGGAQHLGPRQFGFGRRRRGSGRRRLGGGAGRWRPGLLGLAHPRRVRNHERILLTGGRTCRRGRTFRIGGGRPGRRRCLDWAVIEQIGKVVAGTPGVGEQGGLGRGAGQPLRQPLLARRLRILVLLRGGCRRPRPAHLRLLRQALADRRKNVFPAAARRIGLTHSKPHLSLHHAPSQAPAPRRGRHYSIARAAPIRTETVAARDSHSSAWKPVRRGTIFWAGTCGVAARAGAAPRGGRRRA